MNSYRYLLSLTGLILTNSHWRWIALESQSELLLAVFTTNTVITRLPLPLEEIIWQSSINLAFWAENKGTGFSMCLLHKAREWSSTTCLPDILYKIQVEMGMRYPGVSAAPHWYISMRLIYSDYPSPINLLPSFQVLDHKEKSHKTTFCTPKRYKSLQPIQPVRVLQSSSSKQLTSSNSLHGKLSSPCLAQSDLQPQACSAYAGEFVSTKNTKKWCRCLKILYCRRGH